MTASKAASCEACLPLRVSRFVVSVASTSSFRRRYGPDFVAKAIQDRITAVGAKIAYIETWSPWEDGYVESFNGLHS